MSLKNQTHRSTHQPHAKLRQQFALERAEGVGGAHVVDLHPCISSCTFTAPRCLLIQKVSPTTTVITPTKQFWKGSYSFKESFQQMFSHRQHLNKHSNSCLPQSLILPVHSPRMQTQHEINPKVTRLQVPSATRRTTIPAEADSKAFRGNKKYLGFKISSNREQRMAWGEQQWDPMPFISRWLVKTQPR